jgi:hypothetical protein
MTVTDNPYSSSMSTEQLLAAKRQPDAAIRRLWFVLGTYGVGFGGMMLPTGLFVGPHVLVASLVHISIGVGYLYVSYCCARRPKFATWSALALSTIPLTAGVTALVQLSGGGDRRTLLFWGPFTLLFIAFAWGSLYSALGLAPASESTQTQSEAKSTFS